MLKRSQRLICIEPIRPRSSLEVGQQVQITVLKDAELWQGNKRVCYRAGEQYEGNVLSVSADGLLDIAVKSGAPLRLYLRDEAFQID